MRKILQPSQENTFNKVLVEENFTNPTSIYLFKIDNRNNRKMCEICSKFCFFIVNFQQISHIVLFLLVTLNKQMSAGKEGLNHPFP